MSKFFYVIEWHDGSGKTSGIVEASNAYDAFNEAESFTDTPKGFVGCRTQPFGDVITFNKVDD